MGTLAIAYAVGWLAIASYVGWLGIQNRRLTLRLKILELSPHQRGS